MAIFDILNVGQGDSIILRSPYGCTYYNKAIFIDLGPGQYDITKNIKSGEEVHIFLTHHDNDHLQGLRFFIGKMHLIKEFTVPFYQNEITLIAKAILSLKGIMNSIDCDEFINKLQDIINNQVFIKSLVEEKTNNICPKLSFAYEKKICKHIECLNPPILINSFDWLNIQYMNYLINIIYELFNTEFANDMKSYILNSNQQYATEIMENFNFEKFLLNDRLEQYNILEQYDIPIRTIRRYKCNYVLSFIMNNIELLREYNDKPTRNNLQKIYKNYVKCTHDICLVIKTRFYNKTFLLTGDASKNVFNRLIRQGKDISSTYLKMPHHGSKHNMNQKILHKIKPEIAIISHNNRRFGKSKDSHPNEYVLKLLKKNNVKILITNDVIKNNKLFMKKINYNDKYINI